MPYYLGISLGYGMNSLNFERGTYFNNQTTSIANRITTSNSGNLNLGLSGTLKLTNHLLLRANPMLLIGGSKRIGFSAPNNLYVNVADSLDIPSTLITLPIALKLQSDRYTAMGYKSIMRHYVFGGGKADFDLSSSKDITILDQLSWGLIDYTHISKSNSLHRSKNLDPDNSIVIVRNTGLYHMNYSSQLLLEDSTGTSSQYTPSEIDGLSSSSGVSRTTGGISKITSVSASPARTHS